jgi:hypothetical protein
MPSQSARPAVILSARTSTTSMGLRVDERVA